MSARPALQTSTIVNPIDLSKTQNATHVYVKVEDPKGLSPRFEGPFAINSRPSRSQVEVRLGSYVDGSPRLQVYSWNSCKVAQMRPDTQEGSRPKLGRPPTKSSEGRLSITPHTSSDDRVPEPTGSNSKMADNSSVQCDQNKQNSPAKIQTSSRPVRSTRNANPLYVV